MTNKHRYSLLEKNRVFFIYIVNFIDPQILGMTFINDSRGASWGHLYGYLTHAKLAMSFLKDAFPGRLSQLHLMKPPMVSLAVCIQFLRLWLFAIALVHTDCEALSGLLLYGDCQQVRADGVPRRVGGLAQNGEFSEVLGRVNETCSHQPIYFLSLSVSQINSEVLPKHMGGTEYSFEEAIELFDATCTPGLPDKYRT
jgi:hypothetical protein